MQAQVKARLALCGVTPGDTLLLAVSGGRDSMALLHTLCALRDTGAFGLLYAAHLHHGIRGADADADAALVEKTCREWGVQLYLNKANVPAAAREGRLSLEQAAREVRYAFLRVARQDCGAAYILTAHHMEDQAETVLLHLLRGSGLAGLQGMREKSGELLRPMLGLRREEIGRYATLHGVAYREDATNTQLVYLRNRVRLELLPLLEDAYNPNIVEGLSRMAALVQEDEAYLRREALLKLAEAVLPGQAGRDAYRIPVLLTMPTPIRSRALRLALERAGALYGMQQGGLESLEKLLHAQTGAYRDLPGGKRAWVSYDFLCIGPVQASVEVFEVPFRLAGQTQTPLGCFAAGEAPALRRDEGALVAYMDADKLPANIVARPRRAGDRFYPLGAPGRRKFKQYLIDKKIPREKRTLPLLAAADEVLFFPGGTVSELVKVGAETTHILRVAFRNE